MSKVSYDVHKRFNQLIALDSIRLLKILKYFNIILQDLFS